MADQDRATTRRLELEGALEREPYRFDFFQAVRRLECLHPDKAKIGQSLRPSEDPVRLAQEPSMAFAPASLAGFLPTRGERAARMSVYFFGLLGPNGPLPLHLTEYARDRLRNSADPTFARFLDIFHHRLLSLFYRVWANAQPTVSFDRPEEDRFAFYVGASFGLGMPSLRDRDALPDMFKLSHAGQLVCPTRHAEGLQKLVVGYFGWPAEVEPFVGEWLTLPEHAVCRLGRSAETGSLGSSFILGARVWECQYRFRIALGPLGLDDYLDLLPGNASLERLVALVRNYVGRELSWDANLILRKEDVPPLALNGARRLGWTTWIVNRPMDRDADDLCLDPEALMARSKQSEVRT